MVYKILHGLVDVTVDSFFELSPETRTRGHEFKLRVKYSRLEVRKHFFVNRVVNIWNKLPNAVVTCTTLANFKKLLKKTEL